jgi:hypothetical protein
MREKAEIPDALEIKAETPDALVPWEWGRI